MRIFRNHDVLPDSFRGAAVALGNFDGVHRGHAALIARARELAPQVGVLTFAPHPRLVTRPNTLPFLLSSPEGKMAALATAGVDFCIELPFTPELAATAPEDFARTILAGHIGARHLVFGHDFRFGHKRRGDAALLRSLEARHGFIVHPVAAVLDGEGRRFASSAIREYLSKGDVAAAERCLGRPWRIDVMVYALAQDSTAIVFRFGAYQKPAAGFYAVRYGDTRAEAVLRVEAEDDLGRLHVEDATGIQSRILTVEFIDFLGMAGNAMRGVSDSRGRNVHFAQVP